MTRRVSARCVLMCATALTFTISNCASSDASTTGNDAEIGAGDIDDPSTRPGGPGTVGESFDAPDPAEVARKAKEAREARDKRWSTLSSTLRKADAKTLWARGEEEEKSQ